MALKMSMELLPGNGKCPHLIIIGLVRFLPLKTRLPLMQSELIFKFGIPRMADVDYCDMYLVEAAMADLPLSNTFYDPERDGTGVKSLGVLEHWNNPIEKKYSRNQGKDIGIELIYLHK